MILKTAANYNDEGGYIEAWKNSDGTTEVKLIPKSGGDEGGGLKSISISPVVSTTPALADVSPSYYDDEHRSLTIFAELENSAEYTITVTPTSGWFASTGSESSQVGEPLDITLTTDDGGTITTGSQFYVVSQDETEVIQITIHEAQ